MAASLEELLAEEGFRGRRSKMLLRASSGSKPVSMPLYPFRDQHKSGSSSGAKKRTERTTSDVPLYSLRGESPMSDRVGLRPRDNLIRSEKLDRGLKKEIREKLDRRGSKDLQDVSVDSMEDLVDNEIVEVEAGNDIIEVGVGEKGRYKDIYSNELYSSKRSKGKYFNEIGERERYREGSWKDKQVDKRYVNSSNKNLLGRTTFGDNYQKSMKQPGTSYSSSNRSSQISKSFDDRSQRHVEIEQTVAQPALDEVAIQAMISILSGYIKRFLKDEDFRSSLHHNCFASLNFVELEEGLVTECKVIANLEQAIETVERAVEECSSAKELKKASLQLSVITGLNLNDLKDGFTSGILNSKLSACAHLYLSVIYKLQKKDRIAAKHLLQVFCDSPFQARTTLLPELWDYMFLPHLSYLKVWYNQEAESLLDTPSKARKLKLLEKVYNEILDSGTYQFAVYYKDWLTEGVEAPSIPSIHIPSISVQGVQQGSLQTLHSHSVQGVQQGGLHSHSSDIGSPIGIFSPQPMVSKKLYNTVFGRSHKPGVDEVEDYKEAENFDDSIRSSDGSAVEDKQTLTFSPETVKHADQGFEQDDPSHPEDGMVAEQEWRLHKASAPGAGDFNDKFGNSHLRQATLENTLVCHEIPHTKANELTLKRLAKSVFELQQIEESVDLAVSTLSLHSEDAPYPDPSANLTKRRSSVEELHENYGYFDGPFFSSIPQDFICPLTGCLFEDPVTLETGQTFERVAITKWFGKGNRTCPVTVRTLQSQAVPLTNFILKRVINNWKSEHCRHLLAFASQVAGSSGEHSSNFEYETAVLILEQLLTTFSEEERITNAKHLISLGGLQFLIRRFEFGNLEEKTCVAALLSYCIEADSGSRNHIARNIKKQCLLELLHSKQVKSRANSVLLLTELICLNRRKDLNLLLSGLQNEVIVNTMHVLLVYLQSSPPEQRPLVAVLLLHLDLLVEPRKYSIYREEAVDAISVALDGSLSDEKVRANCCRALLTLGGRFSFSGKIMVEDWILKQAGFLDGPESDLLDNVLVDENIPSVCLSFHPPPPKKKATHIHVS
uniref:RING-type E3 ubiquitin transferase n=1 Tax=Davidia involucrata TaxID=16924 RepID=A0A5B6ZW80_DAVIN